MSSKVKSLVKRIKKGWDPLQTGKDAGIDFLNQAGFLRTRFDIIEEMDDQSFIKQDSRYNQAVLPWLNTKKNTDHFERNDAFLDCIDLYSDLTQHMAKLRNKRRQKINDTILEENIQRRLDGEEEMKMFTVEDMENLVVDPDLHELEGKLIQKLLWMGKTLLGISFDSPDDNKTLVLDKQVIFEPNPQTSRIFQLLQEVAGKDHVGDKPLKDR